MSWVSRSPRRSRSRSWLAYAFAWSYVAEELLEESRAGDHVQGILDEQVVELLFAGDEGETHGAGTDAGEEHDGPSAGCSPPARVPGFRGAGTGATDTGRW